MWSERGSGHCGHGYNNLRNAPKVVNYERELKKLKDQIAATSDKEEKSKLIKRLNEVEKQHYVTERMSGPGSLWKFDDLGNC